jgi:phenylacetate-CoA ligase
MYDKAPIGLQNMMISASGYQRNWSRYGHEYQKHRAFLLRFDALPLERKQEYQIEQAKSLISYAMSHSEFYAKLYRGFDPQSIRSLDDLKALPVLEKETLRSNIDAIITIPRRGAVEGHTGGTTGMSLVVLFTRRDMMRRMATLDHFKARTGFENRRMRRATFNGKHIVPPMQKAKVFWRYNAACNQMIYSSFHITEENIPYYIDSLNRYKPDAIDGFFSSICDVANYIERHGTVLHFRPRAIYPTSETLTPAGRELLTRVFGCEVFDQYASSEGAPFITECPRHTYHIEMSSGVFERMDGQDDEMLVTSFTTYGTPLIRYRIGDSLMVPSAPKPCGCGISSIIVDGIKGRRLDFLFTADGARINAGNVANLFKNLPNAIIRAQCEQTMMGKVLIRLEIDEARYLPEYDDILRREFRAKFGDTTKIDIQHVDGIPREASGKFRMIINKVERAQAPR